MNKTSNTDPFLSSMGLEGRSFDNLMGIAVNFVDSEDNEYAHSVLRHITQEYPEHQQALELFGIILQKLQKSSEAEEIFERLLAINPDSTGALFHLSHLQLMRKEWVNAKRHISHAIELSEDCEDCGW